MYSLPNKMINYKRLYKRKRISFFAICLANVQLQVFFSFLFYGFFTNTREENKSKFHVNSSFSLERANFQENFKLDKSTILLQFALLQSFSHTHSFSWGRIQLFFDILTKDFREAILRMDDEGGGGMFVVMGRNAAI